jgi:hypothetical protein
MKIVLLILLIFCFKTSYAQFLTFSFYIDTEVTAGVVQELNFGELNRNSLNEVQLNGVNSGWFQLAVLNAVQFELAFATNDYLTLKTRPQCVIPSCRIQTDLQFAYYIDSDPQLRPNTEVIPLSRGSNFIQIPSVSRQGRRDFTSDYVYVNINVFGQVDVGDVEPGVYVGEISVVVTY